ncbi:MFS transporter [Halarcobacter sp.]|uniref:MFS transporter n=1 Tax=Halarcobacter sp. TaxID=2321133 RepID=UPI002AABD305|nr:MFS transporter [Halarcobacter sp.]
MQTSIIKTSIILFFVVTIVFSTIYTPQAILPTLKEVFHISVLEINLLLSGMLFVLMIATPFYIPISNRFGKKNIMIFCTFFLFLSVLLSSITSNFYVLLFSRFLQGVFVPGITAIMLSYVQEIYPKNHRGLGMGIYMAATSFGAVMGRLLAGWITFLYSWRIAFLVFAILLFIAFFAMIFALPVNKTEIANKRVINKDALFNFLSNIKILSVLIIPTVVFFSFMAISTFATYHLAQEPFNLDASQLGNIFLVLLLGVIISPFAGRYSDIIGRLRIIYLGIAILILGIFLTLSQSISLVIAGLGLVTMGMFSVQSVTPTYLGELVPENKATISILYQSFFYLGGCLGTFLPSIFWEYYKYNGVTSFCIALILIGSLPLAYINFNKKKEA